MTFYNRQLDKLKEKFQMKYNFKSRSEFTVENVDIEIKTVDEYQGHEADIVFLSIARKYGSGLGFQKFQID